MREPSARQMPLRRLRQRRRRNPGGHRLPRLRQRRRQRRKRLKRRSLQRGPRLAGQASRAAWGGPRSTCPPQTVRHRTMSRRRTQLSNVPPERANQVLLGPRARNGPSPSAEASAPEATSRGRSCSAGRPSGADRPRPPCSGALRQPPWHELPAGVRPLPERPDSRIVIHLVNVPAAAVLAAAVGGFAVCAHALGLLTACCCSLLLRACGPRRRRLLRQLLRGRFLPGTRPGLRTVDPRAARFSTSSSKNPGEVCIRRRTSGFSSPRYPPIRSAQAEGSVKTSMVHSGM